MKNVGWLIAAAVAFIGYKMYDAANNLSYTCTSISIDSQNTNLLATTFLVTLRVINPSDQGLTFSRYVGSLNNGGQLLGQINIDGMGKGITIAANTYTDISFPVTISNLSLLGQLLDTLVNKHPVNITLDGVLSIGSINLPLVQTLPLTGKGIGNVPEHATKLNGGLYAVDY